MYTVHYKLYRLAVPDVFLRPERQENGVINQELEDLESTKQFQVILSQNRRGGDVQMYGEGVGCFIFVLYNINWNFF